MWYKHSKRGYRLLLPLPEPAGQLLSRLRPGRWFRYRGRFLLIILSLFIIMTGSHLYAQDITVSAGSGVDIRGLVEDTRGAPVQSAAVQLKYDADKVQNALTDSNGVFVFNNIEGKGPFVFTITHTSIVTKVVKKERFDSNKKQSLYIVVEDKVKDLNDIVVVGYGQVKREDMTGSVATVDTNDLKHTSVMSADLALQGKIAGVDIMATSGEPGAAGSIRIRGTRSITATNEPLIVVDGVYDAVSSLTDINMADIASMSVLKDASATAIYGSRGSNGVILITTKKGKKGKPNMTLKSDFGMSQLPRQLDLMNGAEFAQFRNDNALFSTSNDNGLIDGSTPQADYPYPDPLSMGDRTNWVKEITRNALYQNQMFSLSGGGNKFNYYASLAYNNTQGIIQKSGAKRYTGRLNLSYQVLPWMTLAYKYSYTNRNDQKNVVTIGGTSWWSAAIYLNPLLNPNNVINDLWYSGQVYNSPRSILDHNVQNIEKSDAGTHSLVMDIKPAKYWAWNSQITYYAYHGHNFKYTPGDLPANVGKGGTAYRYESYARNMTGQSTLTYNRTWKSHHHMDAMAGITGQQVDRDYFSLTGSGYLSDELTWNDMGSIPDKNNLTASTSNSRTLSLSYFTRWNYNYASKYYATFTARRDGASNFAPDRKWAFFPSGALKWRIEKENFMKRLSWVDEFSLRLSAGRTGNNGIADYRSLSALGSTTSGYLFDGTQPVAFYPSRLESGKLSWEKTDMYNAATDISLFGDRLSLTFEAYLSYTSDLLLNVQTPSQTGYTTRLANVGKTQNKGIELSINTRNISHPKFLWSSTLTLSHNRQRVDDIGNFDYVNVYGAYSNSSYMMYGYKKGYPLNALWGFKYAGTWKSQEEIDRNKVTKAYISPSNAHYAPGSARYLDVDHNGIFNEQDLVYLGNADADIYGGIQNNFRLGSFFIDVFFSYDLGGKIYNVSEQWLGNGSPYTNQYRYMLDAWHPVRNPDSDIPRAGSNDGIASDRMVHDASFFRLKNLAVGYTWNADKFTNHLIKDLQFVLSGDNLLLWKKYNGFDPDVSSESSSSTLRRVDIGAYPKPRTFMFSVQARF